MQCLRYERAMSELPRYTFTRYGRLPARYVEDDGVDAAPGERAYRRAAARGAREW